MNYWIRLSLISCTFASLVVPAAIGETWVSFKGHHIAKTWGVCHDTGENFQCIALECFDLSKVRFALIATGGSAPREQKVLLEIFASETFSTYIRLVAAEGASTSYYAVSESLSDSSLLKALAAGRSVDVTLQSKGAPIKFDLSGSANAIEQLQTECGLELTNGVNNTEPELSKLDDGHAVRCGSFGPWGIIPQGLGNYHISYGTDMLAQGEIEFRNEYTNFEPFSAFIRACSRNRYGSKNGFRGCVQVAPDIRERGAEVTALDQTMAIVRKFHEWRTVALENSVREVERPIRGADGIDFETRAIFLVKDYVPYLNLDPGRGEWLDDSGVCTLEYAVANFSSTKDMNEAHLRNQQVLKVREDEKKRNIESLFD